MSDTTTAARSIRYDELGEPAAESDRSALQASVSEMLALERRIKAPIARQLEAHAASASADAERAIARIDIMTDVHIRGLEELLNRLGGSIAAPVSVPLPGARETKLSTNLRADYVALSFAAISYTMLQTQALGFGDGSTASLAKQHLDDVAGVVSEINRIMPAVVLQELLDGGLDISAEVRQRALRNTHESWRSKP